MKKLTTILMMALIAISFTACGGPAENKPANANAANANTAKPVAAAPTVEALLALDKAANEAFMKGDSKHFQDMLSESFTSYDMGMRMNKAEMVKMVGSMKCDSKSWSLDEPKMSMINADTYVISYKGTFDGTCVGPDGKSMKLPSPVRAASVWVRNGEKWQGAFHAENPILDPKSPPPPPAKKEAPKKEVAKKEDPKVDDKAAATADTTSAPAKPVASANTAALVKAHQSGWEAFKAKDAKAFDSMLASNFAFVDPMGGWTGSKAEAIKAWTETMKCEGITKVSVTDGFSTSLSPTVEILTSKGTSDGTCDGQKNAALYQTGVYVKEGDAWKLAFMFESLAG